MTKNLLQSFTILVTNVLVIMAKCGVKGI